MRFHRPLLILLALAAACSKDEGPTHGTGPVTLVFQTPVYPVTSTSLPDTVRGVLKLDNAITVNVPDSIPDLARGDHTYELRLDVDYLVQTGIIHVDPSGSRQVVRLVPSGTCRDYRYDADFCTPGAETARNVIYWSQHRRILCPANDYGDFCTALPDRLGLGGTWPADSSNNEYISHARLLIGAQVSDGPAAGHTLAMGLYSAGDYAPRTRLQPYSTSDSSRYQHDIWTDARHLPLYATTIQPPAKYDDRPNDNFGLQVRITYSQPASQQNALFVRYDITNISATPEYRFNHPEEPAAGHTLTNIYLAPVVDADIGGAHGALSEAEDDNGTIFPQDSLAVAYEQKFNTSTFTSNYVTSPGLVGLQLINGPAGVTPLGLLFNGDDTLSYFTDAKEDNTYRILSGGRAGAVTGCTNAPSTGTVRAFVCSPETENDIRIGWSIGPVASLAPGQSTSLTIAVLLAQPKSGAYANGTNYPPQNDKIGDTTRPIWAIAENLRTLAASTKTVTVTPRIGRR